MVLGKLRAILRHKKYQLFTRPYELNIVGMRGNSTEPNRFDDEIHVFYKVSPLKWNYHVYKATTDPGTFWLRNPMQEQGTAILAQGQYVNAYALGLHRGQYEALVQQKPLTIIRDYDRDAKPTDGEQTPVYAMSFELYENGVSRALVLDYNDFVISGALDKFDVKDSKPCKP